MNADELIKYWENQPSNLAEQTATTLRQQADRIAELEKDLAKYDELAIDDLKGRGIVWCACGDSITPDSGAACGNCACTHPAKTLTDEEIKEAKREALKEYYSVLSYEAEFELSWIDELFARAILKKASEK